MIYLVLLVLAFCLARAQHLVSRFNMQAKWNGYGAILSVQDKVAAAPMAYRVLVPWLIGTPSVIKYEVFRFALIYLTLISLYLAWGFQVTLISAVLITVTMYFDYWDWCSELIGFSLALVSFPLALFGVVIHGLSRETAPLVGLVYFLHTGDWIGGAILFLDGLVVLWVVRKIQGDHPLYCKRWMYLENLNMLKGGKVITGQWSVYVSVVLCSLALAGAWGRMDGLIVPLLIGAGWLMAKANETRIFVSVLPYAALFLSRLV